MCLFKLSNSIYSGLFITVLAARTFGQYCAKDSKALSCKDNMLPVVFLSHGGGPCWFTDKATDTSRFMAEIDKDSKSADFMRNLQTIAGLPRHPKAILVVSAHWEEAEHTVTTSVKPSLYFDYYGFPEHTYKLQWPVPGEPEVARRVCHLLQTQGITCREDSKRGLDHGVFVPLKLAYPEADIPVFQLSLKKNLDIAEHLKLGEALQPLREEGVLIIGSGQTSHNMNQMGVSSTPSWCRQFTDWFHDVVTNPTYSTEDRKQRLLECRKQPSLVLAHPRIEHFLPSIVICAAAGYSAGSVLYNETVLGSMVMSTVKFA